MSFKIRDRYIGINQPTFIIAEMSANHNHSFDEAVKIIHEAKKAGADAIKIQTYTPDTITMDSDNEYFRIKGTIWDGETLYNLYGKAYTPWEWQPRLKRIADEIGIIFFSSPFDITSVDFLENMDVPAYKIASFELVDIPLIEYVSSKRKPIIMSTGMASYEEISEAVDAAKKEGVKDIALLKCTSAYPAKAEDMNLKTIPHLAESFQVVSGLSDHTIGITIPVTSVALGASIIEKHFTLSRAKGGPDASFSLEPSEFQKMVKAVRTAKSALGTVNYSNTSDEGKSKVFRRSLFVIKDMIKGEIFTKDNVRSIRPGYGIEPKHFNNILGKKTRNFIKKGTPLSWDLVE